MNKKLLKLDLLLIIKYLVYNLQIKNYAMIRLFLILQIKFFNNFIKFFYLNKIFIINKNLIFYYNNNKK